jgi:acetylornithine deacetylase/succinyl-diaminopimelate desuccinylase-like protein
MAQGICEQRGLAIQIAQLGSSEPVALSAGLINLIEEKTRKKNIEPLRMVSGAGHDSALLADLTATGMIFVPSRNGLSHCPEEYTRLEDIGLACEILLATVMELSNAASG